MALDPAHSRAPFPTQTQGRINRMFAEGKITPVEAADATMELRLQGSRLWYKDPWAIVTAIVFGAVIGIAVGLWSGPWPR